MRRNTEYARLFNTRALTNTAQCAHADTTTYSLYIYIYGRQKGTKTETVLFWPPNRQVVWEKLQKCRKYYCYYCYD